MEQETWIQWFLKQPGGNLFVQLDLPFIAAEAHRPEIKSRFGESDFKDALGIIMDYRDETKSSADPHAKKLYGLLHAVYLMDPKGAKKMLDRHQAGTLPKCTRTLCRGFCCFPCALRTDEPDAPVRMFCPNCTDFYRYSDLSDPVFPGSYFGDEWIHKLIHDHPEIAPNPPDVYEPLVYGFHVFLQKPAAAP
jgi:casein kinase II subunit beta